MPTPHPDSQDFVPPPPRNPYFEFHPQEGAGDGVSGPGTKEPLFAPYFEHQMQESVGGDGVRGHVPREALFSAEI